MAEEQPSSQAPSGDEPEGYFISLDYTSSPALADGPSLAWGPPVVDQGADTGFDEQVYCWGGSSEGEARVESDGGEEVGYPDDPDEVSEHDALSGPDTLSDHDELSEHDAVSDTSELSDPNALSDPDTPSIYKNPSASGPLSNINKQSNSDLAFEVAYDYLRSLPVSASSEDAGIAETEDRKGAVVSGVVECSESNPAPASAKDQESEGPAERVESKVQQRRVARQVKTEQSLPVPESRGDAAAANAGSAERTIVSSITDSPEINSGRASVEDQKSEKAAEHVESKIHQQTEEETERAGSDRLQRRVGRRLKTKGNLLCAISTMGSEVSKLESRIAAMLPSSTATVSDTPTSDARCISRMTKEIENIRSRITKELQKISGKQENGPLPVRPPKGSCSARFASDSYVEGVLPSAKKIRIGLQMYQWASIKRDYMKPTSDVTLRLSGRSRHSRWLIARIWKRAKTVDLGQPTLQPIKSLSRQEWPKPLQQPIEPPPWQSFLESMKRPVQDLIDDNVRQAVSQPDTEREQQTIQQTTQQIARLTVKDAIAQSVGKPVQLPVHAPPQTSEKDLSVEGPVKTPGRSSMKIKLAKLLNIPDQPSAEEPVKKPTIRLLLGKRPVLEQTEEPTEKHSDRPPSRKNPAQRRIELSKRLNNDSGEEAISPSSEAPSSSPQISGDGLAVSGITVVCDFQPTAPDVPPLPPRPEPSSPAPKSKIITLKLPPTSLNPPNPVPTLSTSLQSLTLKSVTNPCPLFRTSSSPTQSPIPTASSPP